MVETSRIRITDAGSSKRRSRSRKQWGALIGGSALAIYGITRRSPLGMALAAGGGTLALVAGTRKRSAQPRSLWTSLLVNCSPEEAYRFWRDFENFPRFMNRLQSVTVHDDRQSRWVALGPMGRPISWNAEITEDRKNESISWRSLPGSDVEVHGEVRFEQAPAGRGTLIQARIEYGRAHGMSGALAKFLRKGASFALRQDLRRLEALLETGEIPTIEGQSHGPRDMMTGVMRMADPTRPIAAGSNLKDVFRARRSIA